MKKRMAEDDGIREGILDENAGKQDENTDKNIDAKRQRAFVYIVKCEDGSLYTGITKDLKKRMGDHYHKTGKGAKYTRSHKITNVMMVWEAVSYSSAAKLEYRIKRLVREEKLKIIASPEEGLKDLVPELREEIYVPRREYVMDIDRLLKEDNDGIQGKYID